MNTSELIAALIACGTPGDLIAEVAKRLFASEIGEEALAKSRKANAARQQRWRAGNVTSRLRNVSHSDTPPVIDPPKEKKGKNPSSYAKPLPTDFELSGEDHTFAEKRGWDEWRRKDEFQRFQDHAKATGRRLTDWRAGWRTWVMSPYNNPKPGAAINGHRRETTAEQGRRLAAQLGRQMQGENGPRGGNEGSDPDVVSLPRDKYGLV